MNFLILTLALATIAGSQSFVLQDDPAPVSLTAKWNKKVNDLTDGIEKAIEDKFEIIGKSKIIKIISDYIDDDDDEEDSTSDGQKKETEPIIALASDIIKIWEKTYDAVAKLENTTEPVLKNLDSLLEDAMAPVIDPIIEKLKPILEPLKEFVKWCNELDHKVDEELKKYVEILDAKVLAMIQELHGGQEPQQKTGAK